jgi:hypothetical protein
MVTAALVFFFHAEVEQIPLLGELGWMRGGALLAFVSLAVLVGLGKLWVARFRERWLTAASIRFNVPVDPLRWVLK